MTKRITAAAGPAQPKHTGSTSKGSSAARQPSSTSAPGAGAAAKISPSKATKTPSSKGKK